MDLVALGLQIKTFVPIFGGRVAGLAEWNAFQMGQIRPEAFPAAFVVPLSEDATKNDIGGMGLYQLVTERVGIVVAYDNTADRRGQSVTQLYEPTKIALHAGILNWRGLDPDHALRGLEYEGGNILDWDTARVFYQFIYTLETTLTEEDGWQIKTPYLVEIDANMSPGDPAPGFKYVAPQPEG